ncbi:MAG: (d)CMP kinase, partial [Nitrospiria bacterium]
MSKRLIIAIDGPAAAGKSSAAKGLAKRLGYLYLDSGSLYRAMAWKMTQEKVNPECASEIEDTCGRLQIELCLK